MCYCPPCVVLSLTRDDWSPEHNCCLTRQTVLYLQILCVQVIPVTFCVISVGNKFNFKEEELFGENIQNRFLNLLCTSVNLRYSQVHIKQKEKQAIKRGHWFCWIRCVLIVSFHCCLYLKSASKTSSLDNYCILMVLRSILIIHIISQPKQSLL